jgi:hypothetical protein
MLFCTVTARTNNACRSNVRLNTSVEFGVFTFVKSHIVICWVMTIYGLVRGVHCFGIKFCFHFQAWETCRVIVHAVLIKTHQERRHAQVISKRSAIQFVCLSVSLHEESALSPRLYFRFHVPPGQVLSSWGGKS